MLGPTSLTWDAIPSLEGEQAGIPLLNGGEVDTAWQGDLRWTLFKGIVSAMSGWDKSFPWHQGPEKFQGKIQLASTSPGAGAPSTCLLLRVPPPSTLAPSAVYWGPWRDPSGLGVCEMGLSWSRIRLQCGRPGFDPWVGKIPWRRERPPTQCSGLENSMDHIVHGVAKSRTRLSDFHFHLYGG